MKPLTEAKQRLATVLDESARRDLALEMFTRTLAVLQRANGISRVIVVSRDPKVLELAQECGAWGLKENRKGLNAALAQATRVAVENGARAVLVIPGDLARLEKKDVEDIIELGSMNSSTIVIAPDRRKSGTNALLVKPAGLIRYSFGPGSFDAHRLAAKGKNALIRVYQSANIAFDVDLPEDLVDLQSDEGGRGQYGARSTVSSRQA